MKDNKCYFCRYFRRRAVGGGTRYQCICNHPNQEYIRKYFEEKRIKKMPAFIGFAKLFETPNKRTPKWCPLLNNEVEE